MCKLKPVGHLVQLEVQFRLRQRTHGVQIHSSGHSTVQHLKDYTLKIPLFQLIILCIVRLWEILLSPVVSFLLQTVYYGTTFEERKRMGRYVLLCVTLFTFSLFSAITSSSPDMLSCFTLLISISTYSSSRRNNCNNNNNDNDVTKKICQNTKFS